MEAEFRVSLTKDCLGEGKLQCHFYLLSIEPTFSLFFLLRPFVIRFFFFSLFGSLRPLLPHVEKIFINELKVIHEALLATLSLSTLDLLGVDVRPVVFGHVGAKAGEVLIVVLAGLGVDEGLVGEGEFLEELNVIIIPSLLRVEELGLLLVLLLDFFHRSLSAHLPSSCESTY